MPRGIKLTDEDRVESDERRKAYKTAYNKARYVRLKTEGRFFAEKAVPRFKEERANGEVYYCDCGCGKVLDETRYTEHYATRKCFIGTFHQTYCNQSIELPVYEG